jgi:hypothetical protein
MLKNQNQTHIYDSAPADEPLAHLVLAIYNKREIGIREFLLKQGQNPALFSPTHVIQP